ncbi:MAG TPA: RecQ family ATP-dependent DNA helicase [Actinomycetota bacterium]|nr:RecQ family ATP-dependent DNA helicase [Actinomycetota bacterium]
MTESVVATRALELLRELSGPQAEFREGQLEAIRALAEDRGRVLVVQRTGWGKSAVYLITTKLLREAGGGPTILVSPLLALMRNQIAMASRLGVRADTINSSNADEWERVEAAIAADTVDLLLVAPERFANRRFQEDVMPVIGSRIGLVVIDEIHCISDWGHDFRPDYLRLRHILNRLPAGIPVVGTTATANNRVVQDVAGQLGSSLVLHRGGLARGGLRLHVFPMPDAAQRLAWLVGALKQLPGTGIVYCLTIRDVDRVTAWLQRHGISASSYSGDGEAPDRIQTEQDLLENRVKAVVATSALGMGFDKPDLSFVIHYQSPGSPIAYYQQVGRAGRALETSWGVLLAGEEDRDIQDWFIKTAFPPKAVAEEVVGILERAGAPVSLSYFESQVNLGRTRLTQMMKVLEVEGAVEYVKGGYRRTEQPWTYPLERFNGVTAARRNEQRVMVEYRDHSGCLMEFLERQLDDPEAGPCGVCMNCAGSSLSVEVDPDLVREAAEYLRQRPLEIEPRKQWPSGTGLRSGKIRVEERLETGRALGEWGDGGWGSLVRKGKYSDGAFHDALVEASVRLIRAWGPRPAPEWVTFVPSLTRDTLVAGFAERLAGALGLPLHPVVAKVAGNRPQKEMQNSAQQYRNVADAFRVSGEVPGGPVLLVDDVFDSRWTLTVIGVKLRESGSGPVFPFALAAAAGS